MRRPAGIPIEIRKPVKTSWERLNLYWLTAACQFGSPMPLEDLLRYIASRRPPKMIRVAAPAAVEHLLIPRNHHA